VLATDSYVWLHENWGKEPFEFARRVLASNVEDMTIDVLELDPARVGTFDIAFFLGVLYHMRDPLLALERVASVCNELLIVTTSVDMISVERPAAAFYPGDTLGGDPTNWWGPNPACVRAMLDEVGFSEVDMPSLRMSGTPNPWGVPHHVASFHARRATAAPELSMTGPEKPLA
jgi:tRNA (mo5U34)-methyltransferase